MADSDKSIAFEEMGGRAAIERVTFAFYERIYDDPWLKQFFDDIPRDHIESQQNDFMQTALGGPNRYSGKTPPSAHQHIYITQEIYDAFWSDDKMKTFFHGHSFTGNPIGCVASLASLDLFEKEEITFAGVYFDDPSMVKNPV